MPKTEWAKAAIDQIIVDLARKHGTFSEAWRTIRIAKGVLEVEVGFGRNYTIVSDDHFIKHAVYCCLLEIPDADIRFRGQVGRRKTLKSQYGSILQWVRNGRDEAKVGMLAQALGGHRTAYQEKEVRCYGLACRILTAAINKDRSEFVRAVSDLVIDYSVPTRMVKYLLAGET